MKYHVYLTADLHVEVETETVEKASDAAEQIIEQAVALAVASPPNVSTVDVCNENFESIEF